MRSRSLLGPADIDDATLAAVVARSWGVAGVDEVASMADVELLDVTVEVAPYDLPALTTAGRYWVRGTAARQGQVRDFEIFVKVVQSWARSPMFAAIPPEFRAQALVMVPWRTEPLIYRSDLVDRLPAGLTMAKALAVQDIDDESAAIWLEAVPIRDVRWGPAQFGRTAYLLGRLAGSRSVAELASIAATARERRAIRSYVEGRLTHAIVPALTGDGLWAHPLVAGAFDAELRAGLVAAVDGIRTLVDELESLPIGTSHGDACPRNLLLRDDSDQITVIDFGFWGEAPLGFDLSQLVLAEVLMGERSADELAELDATCLAAYIAGLRAEGSEASERDVRRAHALLMLIFCGLTAVPFEHLDAAPTPELHRIAGQRATAARFILDQVQATAR